MSRRRWIAGALVGLVAIGGALVWRFTYGTVVTVDAPPPATSADVPDQRPPLGASVVTAPVVYDLGPVIALLDSVVPHQFGNIEKRLRFRSQPRVSAAFSARRAPFRVEVRNGDLYLETEVDYEGRGWYDPPMLPEVSASCGTGGGPRPRVRVQVRARPDVASDWSIRTRTTIAIAPYSAEPRDQCRVTAFKIDVTEKVVEGVEGFLGSVLKKVDRRIARVDVRSKMERIWGLMARPVRLTDGMFLLLQPDSARLVSLGGAGDSLVATVQLQARPMIVTGERPDSSRWITTLPPLRRGAVGDSGLRAQVEGDFDYATLSTLMKRPLVGRSVKVGGRTVRVEDVVISGIGGGRVALGITFGGAVRGRMYFTGTPALDLSQRMIRVPDLDFDVGSSDLLVASLAFMKGTELRDLLREKAAIPDSIALNKVKQLAEKGMNRRLAEGVHLRARLTDVHGEGVLATTRMLVVRANAQGVAQLVIDRALPIGTSPKSGAPRPATR